MANDDDRDDEDGGGRDRASIDREQIEDRKSSSSRITHEVIREEGEEELDRPAMSLIFSGLVAGVGMNASVIAKMYIRTGIPDVPWRHMVEAVGYTLGFLIVVLGRLQLFTESTVTAVLPIASEPSWSKLGKLGKLWALVFLANMVGTLVVAWALVDSSMLGEADRASLMSVSGELLQHDGWHILMLGIPSGFLVGSIAWMLPNTRGQEFWVVFSLTYLIGLGGFSHVVAGSTEAWVLWIAGQTSFAHATSGIILPSLVGNVIGGTFLFAVLAHGQVRGELEGAGSIGEE